MCVNWPLKDKLSLTYLAFESYSLCSPLIGCRENEENGENEENEENPTLWFSNIITINPGGGALAQYSFCI